MRIEFIWEFDDEVDREGEWLMETIGKHITRKVNNLFLYDLLMWHGLVYMCRKNVYVLKCGCIYRGMVIIEKLRVGA